MFSQQRFGLGTAVHSEEKYLEVTRSPDILSVSNPVIAMPIKIETVPLLNFATDDSYMADLHIPETFIWKTNR